MLLVSAILHTLLTDQADSVPLCVPVDAYNVVIFALELQNLLVVIIEPVRHVQRDGRLQSKLSRVVELRRINTARLDVDRRLCYVRDLIASLVE